MKKFDLHVHSTCSKHKMWGIDGINTPEEIVDRAVQIGLDGIAVTDHNTIKGGQRAIQYVKAKKVPLLIIPGAEIRTITGDILAFGLSENIKAKLTVHETIDAIKDQNAIAIVAHPYKYNTKMALKLKDSSIRSRFDAVEVFNANITKKANKKALRFVEDYNMLGIAGSDAHYKMNIGKAITLLDINNLSVDDAFSAIKNNKIKLFCSYTPLRNIFYLYINKFRQMVKKRIGKGNKTCI